MRVTQEGRIYKYPPPLLSLSLFLSQHQREHIALPSHPRGDPKKTVQLVVMKSQADVPFHWSWMQMCFVQIVFSKISVLIILLVVLNITAV